MAVRMALAFAATAALCSAQDATLFRQFFQDVAVLKATAENGALVRTVNGSLTLTLPKIQDVIGLSDAQVEILNTAAADCVAKIVAAEKAASPVIFESRLEAAGSGTYTEETGQRLKELGRRRDGIILSHVLDLKKALGAAAFEKVDAYVRAPAGEKKSLAPYVESQAGTLRKKD